MRRNAKSIFIVFGIMSMILCSCGYPVEGELPLADRALYFMYDINEVDTPGEASVWRAEYAEWDKDALLGALMHHGVFTTGENALGIYFEAGDEDSDFEVLNVGERDKVGKGYIGYGRYTGDNLSYQDLASLSGWHPDITTQLYRYDDNSDFSNQELGIMSSDEASRIVQDALEGCGMTEMQQVIMLALDADTLNMHGDMLIEAYDRQREESDVPDEPPEYPKAALREWTDKDEAYHMRYVQTVEDIPLINHGYYLDNYQSHSGTDVSAVVNSEGLADLQAMNIFSPVEQTERAELISPKDAQDKLMEYYNAAGAGNEIAVESQCLYYIPLVDGDSAELRPAWVFCIKEETTTLDERNETYMDYGHYIIDAITGEAMTPSVM